MSTEASSSVSQPMKDGKTGGLRADVLSGFLVFLIALPLCLGISRASGFPALAGVITAIIGGVLVTFIGGQPMTIKGPAAGLIVIALGAVTELGDGVEGSLVGYHRALACIVVAGVLQTLMGLFKAGKLGDLAPASVVHGMLAAIGIIIFAKQMHAVFGVTPHAHEPFALYGELPNTLMHPNVPIMVIGLVSLLVLFGWPRIKNPTIKKVPAPMVVLLVAVPLGVFFGLGTEHSVAVLGSTQTVGPNFLVTISGSLWQAIQFPDFSQVTSATSIRYIVMFCLVGTIESLLSAKAIDALDPLRRKSDLNRDVLAVGIGNTLCGLVGGLPMISEIVRSSANLNNGASSKYANFFHGVFLLAFVAAAPFAIHYIPAAALAAMLCYTGTRLASPSEFTNTYKVGREQLVIFLVTLVGCVAVDLLVGVALGIVTKFVIHLVNGAPLGALFRARAESVVDGDTTTITVHGAAVFSNYLGIKSRIVAATTPTVVLDLRDCRVVDHTVMERMHEVSTELKDQNRKFIVRGLDQHTTLSQHPMAARKSVVPPPLTAA